MSYKVFIYAVTLVIAAFALSGVNFTNFFKKDHKLEADIFSLLCIISLGYLTGSFIIRILELTGL